MDIFLCYGLICMDVQNLYQKYIILFLEEEETAFYYSILKLINNKEILSIINIIIMKLFLMALSLAHKLHFDKNDLNCFAFGRSSS